jgi:cytochrome c-type biogenesis protein CcmH/NrfF
MKQQLRSQRWVVIIVLAALVIAALAACGGGAPPDEAVADGATLLETRCVQCHDLERTTSQTKTRDQWAATVTDMIDVGAELSDAEAEVLIDYLAETYGP